MANFFSTLKSNRTATPKTKTDVEYAGGRHRSRIAKFGSIDAAIGDRLFIGTFQLSDVIHQVEMFKAAATASMTVDLGPFRELSSTGGTAVLSPISGGTAAEDRFCSVKAAAGAFSLDNPLLLWGESGVPTTFMPLWEALGYTSLELALVDIPDGVVDLAITVEGADPAAQVWSARVVYGHGD